ncbi:hypothetical protein PQR11_10745 [Paraburkholderia strydomiana]|uniref:hypothetical protein n=1 Tax=Paraburkholderia strydomiana TaxID=1245417 RepID=UPI0038B9DA1E
MYLDTEEWTRIRARVLIKGESIRHVANAEAISRNTVRKMVRLEFPPGYLRKCVNERQSVVDQPTFVYAPEGGDGGQQEKLMRMLVPVRRSQRC